MAKEYNKEGWTVYSLIEEVRPSFNMIMAGESWRKAFTNLEEVVAWVRNELPNHKVAARRVAGSLWHNYCHR